MKRWRWKPDNLCRKQSGLASKRDFREWSSGPDFHTSRVLVVLRVSFQEQKHIPLGQRGAREFIETKLIRRCRGCVDRQTGVRTSNRTIIRIRLETNGRLRRLSHACIHWSCAVVRLKHGNRFVESGFTSSLSSCGVHDARYTIIRVRVKYTINIYILVFRVHIYIYDPSRVRLCLFEKIW